MNIATQIFSNTIILASNEINYGGSLDAQTIFQPQKSVKLQIGNIKRVYDENTHGQTLLEIKKKEKLASTWRKVIY